MTNAMTEKRDDISIWRPRRSKGQFWGNGRQVFRRPETPDHELTMLHVLHTPEDHVRFNSALRSVLEGIDRQMDTESEEIDVLLQDESYRRENLLDVAGLLANDEISIEEFIPYFKSATIYGQRPSGSEILVVTEDTESEGRSVLVYSSINLLREDHGEDTEVFRASGLALVEARRSNEARIQDITFVLDAGRPHCVQIPPLEA